jgi:mono/diheme cytochrome c family protein
VTTRLRILLLVVAPVVGGVAGACAHAAGSHAPASFTAAQAGAGATAYQAACLTCHMPDLRGSETVPALTGPSFARRWDGRPFNDLTVYMRDHMPRTLPRVLNDRTYLAVAAYVLEQNGMHPGDAPLTLDATGTISIGSP